jgi:hypothetical protein
MHDRSRALIRHIVSIFRRLLLLRSLLPFRRLRCGSTHTSAPGSGCGTSVETQVFLKEGQLAESYAKIHRLRLRQIGLRYALRCLNLGFSFAASRLRYTLRYPPLRARVARYVAFLCEFYGITANI